VDLLSSILIQQVADSSIIPPYNKKASLKVLRFGFLQKTWLKGCRGSKSYSKYYYYTLILSTRRQNSTTKKQLGVPTSKGNQLSRCSYRTTRSLLFLFAKLKDFVVQ
jgi:hypothetical protein